MKYLKKFEELKLRDYTNTFSENFVRDVRDIVQDLEEDSPYTIELDLTFNGLEGRKGNHSRLEGEDKRLWDSDLPAITVFVKDPVERPDLWQDDKKRFVSKRWVNTDGSLRGKARKIKMWNQECINVAKRLKEYLGDNYLLFTIIDRGDERSFDLDTINKPSDIGQPSDDEWCYFPRLSVRNYQQGDITSFRILYKPDEYIESEIV